MKNIKRHIIFWSCYFLYVYITDYFTDPDATLVKELIFFLSQNIFLFYGLYYVLRRFSVKTKKDIVLSLLRAILMLAAFCALRYFVRYWLLTRYFDPAYGQYDMTIFWVKNLLWVVNYMFFALAYFYFVSSVEKQKALMKSREEKMAEEQAKIQIENTALKAQINPHFLYNTLDFLYAKALPHSAELSDGIIRLADIMRYSIKPQDRDGLARLEEEIEHLENVIDINRLRFNNSIYINFEVEGDPGELKIIPLVLITLVENVLKHGRVNDPSYPATIRLSVTGGNRLEFSTSNKKRSGPKELSTGIGLENIRKRLESAYGSHASFRTEEADDFFHTHLTLQFV
ncbi:sensor histidine kinase [Taibaiella chishuiensis]|uniref:Histidine kinase n=1 Tax=Taibaiella chishuiensis TaxID=1434707 RepID=A0A2P8DBY3_9BACT|nr:histidine kinase [Taibaiella chishuiensis]PSK94714.1 histidine kinase [Taibaiella chishuiensis]